jgi:two-component system OmpR family sensor kinase
MNSFLFGYYFTVYEVLVLLLFIGGVGVTVYWGMTKHWRNKLRALEQKHADDLAQHDSKYFQELHNHLQSAVAHEIVEGLDYISNKSAETLEGLGKEQSVLRGKQDKIIAIADELTQHAANILHLFAPEEDKLHRELLSMRRLVERVLLGLYRYAQSKGVILMPNLDDVEPTVLDRSWTLLSLKNVIHNAIKYSFPGGVVGIDLCLEREEEGAGKWICVVVKDTGKGIPEEDQHTIFELRKRADGLIEPGSGLGLYLARKAARRQRGDVILLSSGLNQGSVFKITFPYNDA